MQLYNPFTDTVVEISKDMPVSRVQRLEARTPDGRYVSHANDATVVHYRMRQHPRGQLVRVTRRGGRSGTRGSTIGKALGAGGVPRTARALLRVGNAAKEFGTGAADTARASFHGQMAAATRAANSGSNARIAGYGAASSVPYAVASGAYSAGRRRGKKNAMAGGVGKRYARDVFGKSSADHTVIADRRGPNDKIPDGARRGRRI